MDKMADCGVTAKVYPAFPSLTFANHITLATGFFPGHHGIVSNSIYDLSISSKPEYLGNSMNDELYVKEPIWSIYQRLTGRKAATISWIGTYHNSTHYMQPHYTVPFDNNMNIDDKFDQVVKWLKLDEDERPGLIMTYISEIDYAGHRVSGLKLDAAIRSVDESIERFLRKLSKEGMLNCVNLVILSDHGMAEIKNRVVLEELFDINGLVIFQGATTLIFRNGSTLTDKEILNTLICKGTDEFRAFNRTTVPARWHCSKSERIGDLIVLGKKGSRTYVHRADIKGDHIGRHGFDFIDPDMHAIMFARGPSFKAGTALPSFMIVEYMNLWTKLLQLPAQENDGEPDFMNMALVSFVETPNKVQGFPVRECSTDASNKHFLKVTCGYCTAADKQKFTNWASCRKGEMFKALSVTSDINGVDTFCYITGCNELAVKSNARENGYVAVLIETYDNDKVNEQPLSADCTFPLIETSHPCRTSIINETVKYRTLSAYPGRVLANEHSLIIPWKPNFVKEILEPLNEYTRDIVKRYGRVISITGTAYEDNYEREYAAFQLSAIYPTHIYRIHITCNGKWSSDGLQCQSLERTKVLSFILPHMDGDPNCLDKNELLLQYTARIKDVEILSGLKFNLSNLTNEQQIVLKLHVNTELW
ncbi:unnamed protein product [Cylicocyclus nassatus]|uniref:Uncharacterized protein n=1 Tax=Cylicocyclus nassatus TaxID=53992 RepID=A0AA36GRI5_CYLNA|nr:unnamed protein product [Cylicocyclus nassatus]